MTIEPQPYRDELREINAYSDRTSTDHTRNQAPAIPAACHDFLDAGGRTKRAAGGAARLAQGRAIKARSLL